MAKRKNKGEWQVPRNDEPGNLFRFKNPWTKYDFLVLMTIEETSKKHGTIDCFRAWCFNSEDPTYNNRIHFLSKSHFTFNYTQLAAVVDPWI